MLAVVTNINTNHDRVTVPTTATIDDFARGDGWLGDRPATCRNFWVCGNGSYLSGGLLGLTPGVTTADCSIYLGGGARTLDFDLAGGSDEWVFNFFADATTGERFVLQSLGGSTFLVYVSAAGTSTTIATAGASTGTNHWTISAEPVSGVGTRIVIKRGTTTLFDLLATQQPTGRYAGPGLHAVGQTFASFISSAALTTYVYDNFTRADSTSTLGTAPTGQSWTALVGTWGISSNNAYVASGAAGTAYYTILDSGVTNCTLAVDLTTFGNNPGVAFRATDVNNLYVIDCGTNGVANGALFKRVGGTYTNLGTFSAALTSGDRLVVVMAGTSLTVKRVRSGVTTTLLTITDSTYTTQTKHGLYNFNSLPNRFDNFSVSA